MATKNLITKYLEKLGIKDPAKDLSPDERSTLETWRKILTEGELTVDRIKDFCEYQLTVLETKFRDTGISDREKANLTLVHSVYSSLRTLIVSPKAEQEALEKYLNSLINGQGGQPS